MIKPLNAKDSGLPIFSIEAEDLENKAFDSSTLFDLSSHTRANEAIQFGLKMRPKGFHVFVVGEDRSGRMTATLDYLNNHVRNFPTPDDWVYLNNFSQPHRPKPYSLPAGMGIELKTSLADLVATIQSILSKTFSHPHYVSQIEAMSTTLEDQIRSELEVVDKFAQTKGLSVQSGPEGFLVQPIEVKNEKDEKKSPLPSHTSQDLQEVRDRLSHITTSAHLASRQLSKEIHEAKKTIAEEVVTPLLEKFTEQFSPYIGGWINEFKNNILEKFNEFITDEPSVDENDIDEETKLPTALQEYYGANVIINNRFTGHPSVILEPNPTYENLFGTIQYRPMQGGGLETNFTMIRPGSLHRANGGILVLRAESIAQDPDVWDALKAALRDREIRIQERHRENALPLLDAPEPHTIPLDVLVFIIGAPKWYYAFFFNDNDFKNHFKIMAEIDPDLPTTKENISKYVQLIRKASFTYGGTDIDRDAIQYLMGYSARWTEARDKLSSKFELIEDILAEASLIGTCKKKGTISVEDVKVTFAERRRRIARSEDRHHEDIEDGLIVVETAGQKIGQINGLSVITVGSHQYGIPSRISARTYAGKLGVINIERLTDMGGPIQQKGAFILDGYLNGVFAQKFPVSCACSLTFEQNYGGVEGDSASLAELIAILSSLSGIPLRQDIALTGSIDQLGKTQSVGGIHHKIEGFFRVCAYRGLSGTQGVILPKSNLRNLILRDDVTEAIRNKKFFIWPVETVEEVVQLLMNCSAGAPDERGCFPKGTVFHAVSKTLEQYHKVLQEKKG